MVTEKSRNKNSGSVVNGMGFGEQRVCGKFYVRVADTLRLQATKL